MKIKNKNIEHHNIALKIERFFLHSTVIYTLDILSDFNYIKVIKLDKLYIYIKYICKLCLAEKYVFSHFTHVLLIPLVSFLQVISVDVTHHSYYKNTEQKTFEKD